METMGAHIKEIVPERQDGQIDEVVASGEFFIVRVDAPPGVEVPGGCYVTIESGPHPGLHNASLRLTHPRARAHTLPDIVFLPSSATVWAMDAIVPQKPRLLLTAADLEKARKAGKAQRPLSRQNMSLRTPLSNMPPTAPNDDPPQGPRVQNRHKNFHEDLLTPESGVECVEGGHRKRHRSRPDPGGKGENVQGTTPPSQILRKNTSIDHTHTPRGEGATTIPSRANSTQDNTMTLAMLPFIRGWGLPSAGVVHPAYSMMMAPYSAMMMTNPGFAFAKGLRSNAATTPDAERPEAEVSPPSNTGRSDKAGSSEEK